MLSSPSTLRFSHFCFSNKLLVYMQQIMHKILIRLDFWTGDVLSHSDTWKFKLTVASYTLKGKNVLFLYIYVKTCHT